jgi:hypothetical protein
MFSLSSLVNHSFFMKADNESINKFEMRAKGSEVREGE